MLRSYDLNIKLSYHFHPNFQGFGGGDVAFVKTFHILDMIFEIFYPIVIQSQGCTKVTAVEDFRRGIIYLEVPRRMQERQCAAIQGDRRWPGR